MAFTPYDAARDMIDRAEALLRLAAALSRKNSREALGTTGRRAVRDDLRRLAVVMAVAALDTYMHRLIVSRAYAHKSMPRKLGDLSIRFEDLISQADTAVAAHKEGRDARPRVAAKRLLRERLLRETFQRYERVSEALSMAGLSKPWSQIAAAMPGTPSTDEVRARLDEVVERRNAIAHEGDYQRLDRPQRATLVEVTPRQAKEAVAFVSALIDAIHSVTT